MRPFRDMPLGIRRDVRAVLCDIDDTITDDGTLPAASYAALEALRAAGLIVAPITGRPAGWCDMIARFWPVDGVVGENGAFYFSYDRAGRRMRRRYRKDAAERAADRERLAALGRRIVAEVPGSAISADQTFRETDLAIDVCEDVAPLDRAAVERILALFDEVGATAKLSSIHVNGWFGDWDKLSMAERFLTEVCGLDPEAERSHILFVGDSPNDAPMFAAFPNAVGVANVADVLDRMPALPAWIAGGRSAAGFVEIAQGLLDARRA